uniref:Uncharacterized protein n=1 Tax=Arundo donax TaxID=35708 RepID=A0A0A9AVH7_ARUDO
MAVARRTTSRV